MNKQKKLKKRFTIEDITNIFDYVIMPFFIWALILSCVFLLYNFSIGKIIIGITIGMPFIGITIIGSKFLLKKVGLI